VHLRTPVFFVPLFFHEEDHAIRATLFVFSLLALPAWAQSTPQTTLSEAEAVRLGLARSDLAELEQGAVNAAEADLLAAGQIPNPTLSYNRDRLGGASDTTEQSWMLSQTFDLSGKRKLLREAAGRRVEIASAGNASRRSELAAEIRRGFYDVLFKQEVIRVTETWARQFVRVEGMVGKLARAGEASGYDRRRWRASGRPPRPGWRGNAPSLAAS
jgi:cobalt-zinc-cadmium efflux system outer membrane protein